MPKLATHALTWCSDTSTYTVRDPEHDRTLAAIFGDALTLTPESQEWFTWLADIPSFAFVGRAGRFTARRETKQRGESYWIAYQRASEPCLVTLRSLQQNDASMPSVRLATQGASEVKSCEPARPLCRCTPANGSAPMEARGMGIIAVNLPRHSDPSRPTYPPSPSHQTTPPPPST